MIRYHTIGHFIEEQRKGFAVHHQMEKDFETIEELSNGITQFLADYNSKYCYGLTFGVSEEPSIVDD